MMVIPGNIYDLVRWHERFSEFAKQLNEEFATPIFYLNSLITIESVIAWKKELHKWEETNIAKSQAIKTKIRKKKQRSRNWLLTIIMAAMIWILIAFSLGALPDNNEEGVMLGLFILRSTLVSGYCGLPIVVAVGGIILLFQIKPTPKLQDIWDPKPEDKKIEFALPYLDDLASTFARALANSPPHREDDYGMDGENLLVCHLLSSFKEDPAYKTDHFICLQRVMVDDNLDADVILIGPTGIWVLESKYFRGRIVLNNGTWYRRKEKYNPNRMASRENQVYENEILEDPADQWLREKEAIITILEQSEIDYQGDLDGLVKGGIVFTHPESILGIDDSSQVDCGHIKDWIDIIRTNTVELKEDLLSLTEVLNIADILLEHSKNLYQEPTFSAVEIAEDVYKQIKIDIVMVLDEAKRKYGVTDFGDEKEYERVGQAMLNENQELLDFEPMDEGNLAEFQKELDQI